MFTMVEFQKTEMPPATRAVVKKFVETSVLLGVIPWDNIAGPGDMMMAQTALPTITKRAIGETYVHSQGTYDPGFEALKIQGGLSKFDRFQVLTGSGRRRTQETEAFLEAIALNFDRDFVKGDQDTDPRDYFGLQARLNRLPNQVLSADPIGGTLKPLSMSVALAAVTQTANPTHWVMSKEMRNWITVTANNTAVGGYITRSKDDMGKEVLMFCDLPILAINKDSTDTKILDWLETITAGGSGGTSIYCVSFRPDRLHGIQNSFPTAVDLGQDPTNGTQYNTLIEWLASIKLEHYRSATRVRDIANALLTLQPT